MVHQEHVTQSQCLFLHDYTLSRVKIFNITDTRISMQHKKIDTFLNQNISQFFTMKHSQFIICLNRGKKLLCSKMNNLCLICHLVMNRRSICLIYMHLCFQYFFIITIKKNFNFITIVCMINNHICKGVCK